MEDPVALDAYTPEWAEAVRNQINMSPVYKQAAANWEGTVGIVVLDEPDKNFPRDLGIFLDLWDGAAREVRICSRGDAEAAKFVITGSYSRWKKVFTAELDATEGIMLGQLQLRGDLPTMVRYTKAFQELTRCTTRVAVNWPDEAAE